MKTTRQPWLAALLLCGLTMPLTTVVSSPAHAYTFEKDDKDPKSYSREDVAKMIVKAKKASKKFRAAYEKADKGGTLPADDNETLKKLVQGTDEWLEKLNTDFNKETDWQAVKPTVQDIVSKARSINQLVAGNATMKDKFQKDWGKLRSDLNDLADAYQLTPLTVL